MKILFDTSYLLPFIKIKIESISDDILLNLLNNKSNEYYYSDLSLFELTAKAFKLIVDNNQINSQDLMIGIDAIQNDSRLQCIPYIYNPLIIELAIEFKRIHNDTIDCIIFASAICNCDCIITMDLTFYENIKNNDTLLEKIKSINKNFKFWFNDLVNSPKSIN